MSTVSNCTNPCNVKLLTPAAMVDNLSEKVAKCSLNQGHYSWQRKIVRCPSSMVSAIQGLPMYWSEWKNSREFCKCLASWVSAVSTLWRDNDSIIPQKTSVLNTEFVFPPLVGLQLITCGTFPASMYHLEYCGEGCVARIWDTVTGVPPWTK